MLVASDIKKSELGQKIAGWLAFVLIAVAFIGFMTGQPRGGVLAFGISAFLPFLNVASRFIRQAVARNHRKEGNQ